MVEVLGQPYILTASAKGLLWRAVIRRHALPNSFLPTLTSSGGVVNGDSGGFGTAVDESCSTSRAAAGITTDGTGS